LKNFRPIILKIGGSVITDKQVELKPKMDNISRIAREIRNSQLKKLILIHGGGSFGHPLALKYSINNGYSTENQGIGFSEIHHLMTVLNGLLIDSLIWNKLPAVSVVPSSFIITKNGRIHLFDEKPLKMFLEMNFLPVLFGDVTLDVEKGFSVLSGDQLVSSLASVFNAERVIMGVDVDGVYDDDPKTNKEANIWRILRLDQLKKIQNQIGASDFPDVTGGMHGKMSEVIKIVEQEIPVTIVNATVPGNLFKALKGKPVKSTLIKKE